MLRKLRTKYLRAPVMVLIGAAADPDPVLHAENRDAASAGVQNLLLAATAAGLASYWSTGAAASDPEVKGLADLGEGDQLVGIVYLGWPAGDVESPGRDELVVRRLTE